MKSGNLLLSLSFYAVLATNVQASIFNKPLPLPMPKFPTIQKNNMSIGPISSPTNPGHLPDYQLTSINNKFQTMDPPMPQGLLSTLTKISVDDIKSASSTQLVFKSSFGKTYYFSQFKEADGQYKIVIPKKFFDEISQLGYNLNAENIQSVTDEEYLEIIKDVKLVAYAIQPKLRDKYLGGEGGRCAAGTIGGAISGAAAGAVGGPAGAVAGAIGGALVGSAASCR